MFLLTAASFIVLGVTVLVAVRLVYANLDSAASDTMVLTITIAGWLLIFFGFAIFVTPFGMILALLIFGMTVAKFRDGERRALLWTLALAAEKGLPLAPSARAFATRRCDEMARRAWLLADLLEDGVSLPQALTDSGNPLPVDTTLMVRLGGDSQATAVALRESAEHGGKIDNAWKPVFEQTIYLLMVATVCLFVTSFIMIRIIPTYQAIFADFDTELPTVSILMIRLAERFANYWFLLVPLVGYLAGAMLISAFFYAQGKIWIPPPFDWIFGRSDNPTVLRGLAVCVDQQLPIDQALLRLANHHPKFTVGRSLARAAERTHSGTDWCDSLQSEKMVTPAEAAVLKSAARAGNLSWALREMAEVSTNRLIYRAKTLLCIATPICLLLMAMPVALLTVGCFIPLVKLIENLV